MSAHAEIDEVWPRDGRIGLVGRLHGRDAGSDRWRLVLTLRGSHRYRLHYDAALDGSAFDVSLPVDDLALDGLPKAVWDLHLATHLATGAGGDEEELLTVGRHLDDVSDKRKIYVFPAQSVTSDEDATVVRPVYTAEDDLSVECVPGDLPLRRDELPFERAGWKSR